MGANTRRQHADMRLRDGFIVVVMFWTVLGAFGTLPFLLSDASTNFFY